MTAVLLVCALTIAWAFLIRYATGRPQTPLVKLREPAMRRRTTAFNSPTNPPSKPAARFHSLYQDWLQEQADDLPRQLFTAPVWEASSRTVPARQGDVLLPFFQHLAGDNEELGLRLFCGYAHGFYLGRVARSYQLATATHAQEHVLETAGTLADDMSAETFLNREFRLAVDLGVFAALTGRLANPPT